MFLFCYLATFSLLVKLVSVMTLRESYVVFSFQTHLTGNSVFIKAAIGPCGLQKQVLEIPKMSDLKDKSFESQEVKRSGQRGGAA